MENSPPQSYCLRRAPATADTAVEISPELSRHMGDTTNPQGVFCIAKTLDNSLIIDKINIIGTYSALEDIQDPGNIGTILRTADALESPVVLLEGCADPYSHKVVRASMGAVFRTPVVQTNWETVREACSKAGIPVAVTALSERAEDLRRAKLSGMAVAIGSEGRGVRPELLEQADRELIIPMNPRCESLNAAVAATIVMWQMKD